MKSLELLKQTSTTDLNQGLWILSKKRNYTPVMRKLINAFIKDIQAEYEARQEQKAKDKTEKIIDEDIQRTID